MAGVGVFSFQKWWKKSMARRKEVTPKRTIDQIPTGSVLPNQAIYDPVSHQEDYPYPCDHLLPNPHGVSIWPIGGPHRDSKRMPLRQVLRGINTQIRRDIC